MGRKIGAVSFLEILAPELNDRILSDILDLETGVIVNLHIQDVYKRQAAAAYAGFTNIGKSNIG